MQFGLPIPLDTCTIYWSDAHACCVEYIYLIWEVVCMLGTAYSNKQLFERECIHYTRSQGFFQSYLQKIHSYNTCWLRKLKATTLGVWFKSLTTTRSIFIISDWKLRSLLCWKNLGRTDGYGGMFLLPNHDYNKKISHDDFLRVFSYSIKYENLNYWELIRTKNLHFKFENRNIRNEFVRKMKPYWF